MERPLERLGESFHIREIPAVLQFPSSPGKQAVGHPLVHDGNSRRNKATWAQI